MKAAGRKKADEVLAAQLAAGAKIVDAAAAADVSESTAYRRLKHPEFSARVRELRGEMVDRAAGKLSDSMTMAVETMLQLLHKGETHAVKLRSADLILSHAVRLAELSDLQLRVSELERRAAGVERS